MNYSQLLSVLFKLRWMKPEWDLANVRKLLSLAGSPENDFPIINVGGTNGKGSTTVMLASILRNSGFVTGSYYSPHLDDFRERIRVDGEMISEKDAVRIFEEKILPHLDNFSSDPLSFFEIITVMALVYFSEKNVEYAVLEVGLGGRLDATNVGSKRPIQIITNVSLEHTEQLGKTVSAIAREKSGTIQPNSIVVTAETNAEALAEIRLKTQQCNSKLIRVHGDVKISGVSCSSEETRCIVHGLHGAYNFSSRRLLGRFQCDNAGCAVAAAEALGIVRKEVEVGLRLARISGRLEVWSRSPLVVMDAAHNPSAALKLFDSLSLFSFDKLILLVGFMRDKDYSSFLKTFSSRVSTIIINKPGVERAEEAEKVAVEARKYCSDVRIVEDVKKSFELGKRLAGGKDLLLVTGSIYMLAEARGKNKLQIAQ
ncbi:hypothetical protein HY992_05885 [Candidatus Micrarchaeota archaeon]|nr:hypothetical protein [Candidatus Micrarchaeota archaeon]